MLQKSWKSMNISPNRFKSICGHESDTADLHIQVNNKKHFSCCSYESLFTVAGQAITCLLPPSGLPVADLTSPHTQILEIPSAMIHSWLTAYPSGAPAADLTFHILRSWVWDPHSTIQAQHQLMAFCRWPTNHENTSNHAYFWVFTNACPLSRRAAA